MIDTLFVDQTGQLGGAELCLGEIVSHRNHPGDCVALLAEGPFAEMLRNGGTKVEVCAFSNRSERIQKGSGLWAKLRSVNDVWRVARRIARVSRDYDVVYANTAKALVVASLARQFVRKPLIFHLHDILSREHFSASNLKLLVTLARNVDAVIANSDATKEAFIDAGGRGDLVSVIANGIDFSPFDEAAQQAAGHRARIREELGVGDEKLVGLFGRLSPWKGQDVAIRAIASLESTHMVLVGDALFGEDAYRKSLHQTVEALGIGERIHFTGFRRDIAELMCACDVVLHASTAPEPFGRVIVEAMVSRRPVVVADAGGAATIVRDGVTGWLYKSGDDSAMRDAILSAMNDSKESMLQAAFDEARAQYDQGARASDVIHLIDDVSVGKNLRHWASSLVQPK